MGPDSFGLEPQREVSNGNEASYELSCQASEGLSLMFREVRDRTTKGAQPISEASTYSRQRYSSPGERIVSEQGTALYLLPGSRDKINI